MMAFASMGFLTPTLAIVGAAMTLPAAAGMWLGRHLAGRVDAQVFRTIVLILLAVLGANLVRRALF
jgi:uncharacterized membrane protein YfcA